MIPIYSGLFVLMSALLLGYFAFYRWLEFKKNPSQPINRLFFIGIVLMMLGDVFCAITGFFPSWVTATTSFIASIGIILQSLGYGYLLFIPLRLELSDRKYLLASSLVMLYVIAIAVTLVIKPPVRDVFGYTVHWVFTPFQGGLITALNVTAFLLNIYILYKTFRNVMRAWWPKLITLIGAFSLAGVAGAYIYMGTNHTIINYSFVMVFLGLFIAIIGSLFGPLNFRGKTE